MAECCGYDLAQLTKSGARMIGTATSDIRNPQATSAQVWDKARIYKELHPKWELTPMSLVKYWAELQPEKVEQKSPSRFTPIQEFLDDTLAGTRLAGMRVLDHLPWATPVSATVQTGKVLPSAHGPACGRKTAPRARDSFFDAAHARHLDDGDYHGDEDAEYDPGQHS